MFEFPSEFLPFGGDPTFEWNHRCNDVPMWSACETCEAIRCETVKPVSLRVSKAVSPWWREALCGCHPIAQWKMSGTLLSFLHESMFVFHMCFMIHVCVQVASCNSQVYLLMKVVWKPSSLGKRQSSFQISASAQQRLKVMVLSTWRTGAFCWAPRIPHVMHDAEWTATAAYCISCFFLNFTSPFLKKHIEFFSKSFRIFRLTETTPNSQGKGPLPSRRSWVARHWCMKVSGRLHGLEA